MRRVVFLAVAAIALPVLNGLWARRGARCGAALAQEAAMGQVGTAERQGPLVPGPQDQFYSVIYVRGWGDYAQRGAIYRALRPHTMAHGVSLEEARKWGGKYVYTWHSPHAFDMRPEAATPPAAGQDIDIFPAAAVANWDAWRAAGVVTGE